ncbi:PREDICTED: uncharacterized protein LOC105316503 [Amphimedon queenslandica]|uniref:RING-CH-type domain-containing protein n=1 Tax=Amphimedon queenslandica TaxID=400682 RepID=A0A1X7VN04_AMPQE|nr:PREDICTED: uncharacterized protein LOC105316503 [Amphimedon queenslandica]|eukprot:XP_011409740.1 PREDICTED: uncharacterized protein LOC105316503 [Amphimedon queenslandica]
MGLNESIHFVNVTGVAGSLLDCGPANCSFPQGTCKAGVCECEVIFGGDSCESLNEGYLTVFAVFSYIIFFIASVQLILCMISDSLVDPAASQEEKWKKAFRITIQKCILGTVIAATGTRAIYFTVQLYGIPERWANMLHNIYYPTLITAFSVLICFWAELFYNTEVSHTQHFLNKTHYFIACTVFNLLVYLLLLSDIIATPLVNEVELARKSIVLAVIFATLLLIMLAGFMHYAVRLFFRPDWRPLSDLFIYHKINLNIQISSIVGILSSAVMQCIIIILLILNVIGHYVSVDSHSLYTSSMVIHIIELGLPIWFCCCLWNFKRPTTLWVLNPGLLLQPRYNSKGETDSLITANQSSNEGYGTITDTREDSSNDNASPDCWICLDSGEVSDLFRPCSCPAVHRACLNRWVAERASNDSQRSALQCQVCKKRYAYVKKKWRFPSNEVKSKHWGVGLGLAFVFILVSSMSSFIHLIPSLSGRVAVTSTIIVIDVILLKLIGFCLLWLYKRSRVNEVVITGEPVHYSSNPTAVRLGVEQSLHSSPQHSIEPNNAPRHSTTTSTTQHLPVQSAAVPESEPCSPSLDTSTTAVCVSLPGAINSISINAEVMSVSIALSTHQ